METNEEIYVTIGKGKTVTIKYLNSTQPDELGNRLVFFVLNGQSRTLQIRDKVAKTTFISHSKAKTTKEIGVPLQGSLAKILVHEGDTVNVNTPLFVIEAMKMESTITSPVAGVVKKVHLTEKTLVEQDDLVIELE
jgi:pyruvate carboxylase